MVPDQWGFLYPQIKEDNCINCGLCEKTCPVSRPMQAEGDTAAYSACNRDEEVRLSSSSGGVFTILAAHVIRQGGVVIGAAFDDQWNVAHACAETLQETMRFKGAKYAQSRIGDSYRQAKGFLTAGRTVLFSGTPCQIGGLKGFLGKEYENLICVDLICHGVPAPGLWRKYLKEREKKAGAAAKQISFRCKKKGWKNYVLSITFENGKQYQKSPGLDPYMRAFLSDLSLRPSCSQCSFKGASRQADLTLADFWGIQQLQPEMDDNKGTSLVLVHTARGKRMLDIIHRHAALQEVEPAAALQYNPAAVTSANRPETAEAFMEAVLAKPFAETVEKYAPIPAVRRIKMELWEKIT